MRIWVKKAMRREGEKKGELQKKQTENVRVERKLIRWMEMRHTSRRRTRLVEEEFAGHPGQAALIPSTPGLHTRDRSS